jgi:hypothetical protein
VRKALSSEKIENERLNSLISDSKLLSIQLDTELIALKASNRIADELEKLTGKQEDVKKMESLIQLIKTLNNISAKLDLWRAQNIIFKSGQTTYKTIKDKPDEESRKWTSAFQQLCDSIGVRLA